MQQLIKKTQGKTLIVVSNKVSAMKNLDRIYVLVDGTIIAEGTHEQLLEENFLYQELYQYEKAGELI